MASGTEKPGNQAATRAASTPDRRRSGRPRTHGAAAMRRTLRSLTTRRLDGRSALARAVREWKATIRDDLGGDLTKAQETILEIAVQTWVQVSRLDDWLARQPSLVNARKRAVIPVLRQRAQLADSLARHLERLGLERRVRDADSVDAILARMRTPGGEG